MPEVSLPRKPVISRSYTMSMIFYRAYCSEERATLLLSIRPSVTLRYRGHIGL